MHLAEHVAGIPLLDHHVHGCFVEQPDRSTFENALNEANTAPLPAFDSGFDTQLGFAIRAHCAPLIGLQEHADADAYWARRVELGEIETARRLLASAGVDGWLVDEGYTAGVCSRAELAELGGGTPYEIVRLEQVAEEAVAAGGSYADAFRDRLAERLAPEDAVGMKTIIAYRTGFAVDWSPVADDEADRRGAAWRDAGGTRLADARLLVFGIRHAMTLGLPLQFHVGFGDRDCDLDAGNPLLLLPLLRDLPDAPVALLHCYPYEREAGYLAQGFAGVHLDVGLAINYLGARSPALIARSFELAPFRKLLYSSDAYGPSELHALGSILWRRGTAAVLERFVEQGEWSEADARRVATLVARENAERLYRL